MHFSPRVSRRVPSGPGRGSQRGRGGMGRGGGSRLQPILRHETSMPTVSASAPTRNSCQAASGSIVGIGRGVGVVPARRRTFLPIPAIGGPSPGWNFAPVAADRKLRLRSPRTVPRRAVRLNRSAPCRRCSAAWTTTRSCHSRRRTSWPAATATPPSPHRRLPPHLRDGRQPRRRARRQNAAWSTWSARTSVLFS